MLGKGKARGELLEKKANKHKNAQLPDRVSSSTSHSEKWEGEGSSCLDASHQPQLRSLDGARSQWEAVPG